jgi:hypothetical protein
MRGFSPIPSLAQDMLTIMHEWVIRSNAEAKRLLNYPKLWTSATKDKIIWFTNLNPPSLLSLLSCGFGVGSVVRCL